MKLLRKSKLLYWVLQWTWGLVANICGAIFLGFLAAIGKISKVKRIEGTGVLMVRLKGDKGWGLSLGMFAFVSSDFTGVVVHEAGHSIQNIIFGPLFLVVVGIPSITRAALFNSKWAFDNSSSWLYKWLRLDDYYAIWFESQANEFGAAYAKEIFDTIKYF